MLVLLVGWVLQRREVLVAVVDEADVAVDDVARLFVAVLEMLGVNLF